MAITISEQLSKINDKIRTLKSSANDAAQNVKLVGESLKFDPKNVTLVQERLNALNAQVKSNEDLLKKYNEKIDQLNQELKDLEAAGEGGGDLFQYLSKELTRTENAAKRAEFSIKLLQKTIDGIGKQQRQLEEVPKNFEKIASALRSMQQLVTPLASSFRKLGQTIINTIKTSAEWGAELYNLSVRYNTSTVEIQRWNKALQLATGDADLFTKSVNTMIKGISQITSGRGVAYRKALKNIGLAYSDLQGLGTEDQFNKIVTALGKVEDADLRLSAAQQLLGESGQSIAGMFDILKQEGTTLDEYLEKADKYSKLTKENASALKTMSNELDYLKSELQVAGAELAVAFIPLVDALVPIIKDLAEAIKKLGEKFQSMSDFGKIAVIVLVGMLAILPTLLSMLANIVTLIGTLPALLAAIQASAAPILIVLVAIAAVIISIIALISHFSKKAREAKANMDSVANAADALSEAGGDYGATVERTATESKVSRIEGDFTYRGEGNTPISDEAAMKIAQLSADEINKKLGELIK